MTIKTKEREFEHPEKNGEKQITRYHIEIIEQETRNPSTFLITESVNKTGAEINRNLVFATARYLSDYYDLKKRQVTIFAEKRDGDFYQYKFTHYRSTIGAPLEIDYISRGGARIEVSMEHVEKQVSEMESWKHKYSRQVDFNFEEAGLPAQNKFLQNPDTEQKQEQKQEQKLKLEF